MSKLKEYIQVKTEYLNKIEVMGKHIKALYGLDYLWVSNYSVEARYGSSKLTGGMSNPTIKRDCPVKHPETVEEFQAELIQANKEKDHLTNVYKIWVKNNA